MPNDPNDPSFLDVEDDEQRQNRISTLLERLNTTLPALPLPSDPPNPLLDIGRDRVPGPVEPPTELLARVQAFLPTIHASNEALSQANPQDLNIENVGDDEVQYIEMNLGLGVFETKRPKENGSHSSSSSSSESSSNSSSSSESSSLNSEEDSGSSSSSSDDSESSEEGSDSGSGSFIDTKPISSRPIKPLPRRASQQTKIEVLSSHPESVSDADIT